MKTRDRLLSRVYVKKKKMGGKINKNLKEKEQSKRIALNSNLKELTFLDCACNLSGTQATSASVNTTRRTINDSFYSLNVGLPSTVGTSVRVGNFNTESNFFAADITFSHALSTSFRISP